MKKGLCIILLFISQVVFTQTEQAWVYFTAKPNANQKLQIPSKFLTEKAISRKQKYNIPIDHRDLPIDELYIARLKLQTGITLIQKSKWFNAAYISGTKLEIDNLLKLSFVSSIFYSDRSLNESSISLKRASAKKIKQTIIKKFENVPPFNYGNTITQVNQINLAALHDLGFTGKGITIAVLDGGFKNVDVISAFDKARANGQLLGGYDFRDKTENIYAYKGNSHGTNVLSTMLAYVENQFVGTAPDANYYLFRTEIAEIESPEEEAHWIAAAEQSDSLGVDILNTSLGYTQFDELKYDYSPSNMDGNTAFISKATNIALEKGMIPVTSAGNSGNNPWGIISAPADAVGALSVGAIDFLGDIAPFSSVGPTTDNRIKPDIVALGKNSSVISEQGLVTTSNGTSFSGPIVAGAVASLWQALPNKNAQQIIEIIKNTASLANQPNTNLGFGIPDFHKAYSKENESLSETVNTIDDTRIQLVKNPIRNAISFIYPEKWEPQAYFIYSLSGKEIQKGKLKKEMTLSSEAMNTGIYFLRINGEKVIRFIKK